MPGQVFHEEIADMIKKGCRKTIIILSPDYIRSPWCNYEANLAFMKSPGELYTMAKKHATFFHKPLHVFVL